MTFVSVIVPCYNEQATISLLLDAIYQQTYPLEEVEVIVADGLSTDQTRQRIDDFRANHQRLSIQVVDNQKKVIPSALNRAIEAARGEVIIRLDAHSIPAPDYIQRSVQALGEGKGDNIGGVWQIRPSGDSWIARSIAAAAAHPLGVGDAVYRLGGQAQEVDTVPFGAFRRDLLDRIGMFDETLLTNEDYEFNVRIRQAGGKVWLDPGIKSAYFARANLKALAGQYWRYGYWKAQMLQRYPATLRWRQGLPPAFVSSLLGLGALAFWLPTALWLLITEISLYSLILFTASIRSMRMLHDPAVLIGLPLSIATMHLSWGTAFLWGMIAPPPRSTQVTGD